MRLEVRGQCPQYVFVAHDVDVLIHRDDGLQIRIPAQQAEHDLARFARARLAQGDIGMEMRARAGVVHCRDAGEALLELFHHFRFARHSSQVQMLGGVAAQHIHQHGIAPAQDALHPEQVVGGTVGGVAGELAERAFIHLLGRIDHAFEHIFGIGRHRNAMTRCAHHLQRGAEQAAGDMTLVHAQWQTRRAGQHEQRMGADHHRCGQGAAQFLCGLEQPPQMTARMQAGGQGILAMQHGAMKAHVAVALLRMLGNDHAIGDVGRTVGGKVLQQRQAVQIDVVLLHQIEDRSAGQLRGGAQIARPALVFGMNAGRIDTQHAADALARSEQVGHGAGSAADGRHAARGIGGIACAHLGEQQQRMPSLLGQRTGDGGDLLISRHRLAHLQHIVGMGSAIVGQKAAQVLRRMPG